MSGFRGPPPGYHANCFRRKRFSVTGAVRKQSPVPKKKHAPAKPEHYPTRMHGRQERLQHSLLRVTPLRSGIGAGRSHRVGESDGIFPDDSRAATRVRRRHEGHEPR